MPLFCQLTVASLLNVLDVLMDRGIGPNPILVHLCDQVRLCQQLRRLCQRVL